MVRIASLSIIAVAALASSSAQAAPTAGPNYALVKRIAIPDGRFDYASFDPAHRRLYISRVGAVAALDVDSGVLTAHLADGQHTHESLVLDGGANLLITDSGTSSAHFVNALTGAVLSRDSRGKKPDAAIFDPASGMALVMNGLSGDVTVG